MKRNNLFSLFLLLFLVPFSSPQLLMRPLMSLAGGLAGNLNPFQGLTSSFGGGLTGGLTSGLTGGGLLSSLRGSASSLRGMSASPTPMAYPSYPPSYFGSYAAPSNMHFGHQRSPSTLNQHGIPMLSPQELAEIVQAQAQTETYRNPPGRGLPVRTPQHPQTLGSTNPPQPSPKPASPPSPPIDDEEYEDEVYEEDAHLPPPKGNHYNEDRDAYTNEDERDYRRPSRPNRRPTSPPRGYGYRNNYENRKNPPSPSNHVRSSERGRDYRPDDSDYGPRVPASAAGGFDPPPPPPPPHYEPRNNDRVHMPRDMPPRSYSYNTMHNPRPHGYDRTDDVEDDRDAYRNSPSEPRDVRSSTYGYYNSEEFTRNEPPPPPRAHRPVDEEEFERDRRQRNSPGNYRNNNNNMENNNNYHQDHPPPHHHHHSHGPYH